MLWLRLNAAPFAGVESVGAVSGGGGAGATGWTVNVAFFDTPPAEAVMVTTVVAVGFVVSIMKPACGECIGIVTDDGTRAMAGWLLFRLICVSRVAGEAIRTMPEEPWFATVV